MNMKGKKLIASLITVIATLCVFFGQTASYAVQTDKFYVGITAKRTNSTPNTAYSIGNPTTSGGATVWDLISYGEDGTTLTNKNLYCVKGEVGDTWLSDPTAKVEYTKGYDLKTDPDKTSILSDISTRFNNITTSNYYNILWIVDNLYIPSSTEYSNDSTKQAEARKALLRAAGIDYDDTSDILNDIKDDDEYKITDDDIEVVQQLALWYYTNSDEELFHKTADNMFDSSLFVNSSLTADTWKVLKTINNPELYGDYKTVQLKRLYNYLINTPENIQSQYNASNDIKSPVTISEGTLGVQTTGDGKYLLGPISVTKNNNFPYTLEVTLTNQGGTTIPSSDYSIVNASGNAIDINSANSFYIKANSSDVNVTVTVNYYVSTAVEWLNGGDNTDREQPVLEVKKKLIQVPYNLTPNDSKFDLALRKFITAVSSDVTIDDSDKVTGREPVVSNLDALKAGTVTTATYTHPKTALTVKDGDYIEYTIRVYNEGNVSGYAREITDYILENRGLEFVEPGEGEGQSKVNKDFGWVKSGNKVTTDYLKDTLLNAFNDSRTTLDYQDIKIEFKVKKPTDYTKGSELVNIAEISKARKEGSSSDIVEGDDRDSNPSDVKDDKYNYPDDGYTADHQHEDDIDFEPINLFEFDLRLRKFISAVSSDGATFEEGEYLTGSASREPEVSYENGNFAYEHSKTSVPVKT